MAGLAVLGPGDQGHEPGGPGFDGIAQAMSDVADSRARRESCDARVHPRRPHRGAQSWSPIHERGS